MGGIFSKVVYDVEVILYTIYIYIYRGANIHDDTL